MVLMDKWCFLIVKTLRVIDEQIGIGQSALSQAIHPWENGKL